MTTAIVTSSSLTLKRFLRFFIFVSLFTSGSICRAEIANDPLAWRPGQALATVEPETSPFWRSKPKVWRSVAQDRAIVATVKTRASEKSATRREELFMQGAGLVSVPAAFAFERAQRFSDLPRISSVIKRADYDRDQQLLDFQSEAFRYQAYLKMQIELRPGETQNDIRFRVIKGEFTGMTGVLRFEDQERRKTLISMTALFAFDKLPMPQFFVKFGLEVVMKVVAGKMRTYLEEEWGKAQQAPQH